VSSPSELSAQEASNAGFTTCAAIRLRAGWGQGESRNGFSLPSILRWVAVERQVNFAWPLWRFTTEAKPIEALGQASC
jgi:hypothetical protein